LLVVHWHQKINKKLSKLKLKMKDKRNTVWFWNVIFFDFQRLQFWQIIKMVFWSKA
jgi:hypothetical protein